MGISSKRGCSMLIFIQSTKKTFFDSCLESGTEEAQEAQLKRNHPRKHPRSHYNTKPDEPPTPITE